MNADELSAAVEKLQEANPTLQYDINYNIEECGLICVNGLDYLGDKYWERKHPVKSVRPTIVEKLGHDKVWWTKFTMEFKKKTNAIMRLQKLVLAKKVQAMILAKRVKDIE